MVLAKCKSYQRSAGSHKLCEEPNKKQSPRQYSGIVAVMNSIKFLRTIQWQELQNDILASYVQSDKMHEAADKYFHDTDDFYRGFERQKIAEIIAERSRQRYENAFDLMVNNGQESIDTPQASEPIVIKERGRNMSVRGAAYLKAIQITNDTGNTYVAMTAPTKWYQKERCWVVPKEQAPTYTKEGARLLNHPRIDYLSRPYNPNAS